jgi:hypothetical protein
MVLQCCAGTVLRCYGLLVLYGAAVSCGALWCYSAAGALLQFFSAVVLWC